MQSAMPGHDGNETKGQRCGSEEYVDDDDVFVLMKGMKRCECANIKRPLQSSGLRDDAIKVAEVEH